MSRPAALLLLGAALLSLAGGKGAGAGEPPTPKGPGAPPSPLPPPRYVPGGPVLPTGDRAAAPPRGAPAAPPATPSGPAAPPKARAPERASDSGLGSTASGTLIRVDPRVGEIKAFQGEPGTQVLVLTGNPTVRSEDGSFAIKARTIVAWLDSKSSPQLLGALGTGDASGGPAGSAPAAGTKRRGPAGAVPAGKAPSTPAAAAPRAAGGPDAASGPDATQRTVIPEALLAVYAEGAVDFVAGDMVFRASELYFDARGGQALLVDPRFDARVKLGGVEDPVPLHVRAERARVVANGLAVLDRAEATTTHATDGIRVKIARLTVEEYGQAEKNEQVLLGFRVRANRLTQHLAAESIQGRGERLPLFYWPAASVSPGSQQFPVSLRRLSIGSRSSFGRWGIVGVGKEFPVGTDGKVDVTAVLGYYQKRGPAAGFDVQWKRPGLEGKIETFYVNDRSGEDRDGYRATDTDRWKGEFENRWDVSKTLRFDAEVNDFSDRGFDQEFFESDFFSHKDRETYGRLRWMEGGTAGTLTAGFHLRDFVTESHDQPVATLWSESLPVLRPGAPGGVGLDLSSVVSGGRLVHWSDKALDLAPYEAERLVVDERLYAPFDVGDVRISPFVGVQGTAYFGRTDGGDDLVRGALEAGVRANLQLHRDFDAYGGLWGLDGLRHSIDLDAGVYRRFADTAGPADVPFFDAVEDERDRTEVTLEARTRLETRRVTDGRRGNASVLDASAKLSLWPEDVGPYGKHGPGEVQAWLWAELFPRAMWLRADSVAELEGAALAHSSVGVQYEPKDDLELSAGLRHVQGAVLSPWFDGYWRWTEKWGARVSFLKDFEQDRADALRVVLFRFSEDHIFELGLAVRHGGDDVALILDLVPAIGGTPVNDLYEPHDRIDRAR